MKLSWRALLLVMVVYVLCVVVSSAYAADCVGTQKPYQTPTICGVPPMSGDTVLGACQAVLPHLGGTVTASGNACTFTADCGGGPRTVAQVCTVAGTTPPATTSTGTVTSTAVICNGTCTLAIKHSFENPTTAAPLTASMVGSYMDLWEAFLLLLVCIVGWRAVYSRFRIDYDH